MNEEERWLLAAIGRGDLEGVLRWVTRADGLDLSAEVESVADDTDWRVVELATEEADGKEGFLEACADAFALPDWFGMNWDALEECLRDLDLTGVSGVLVVWTGWEELAEGAPETVATAVDVLRSAVRSWVDDGSPGAVLLAGPAEEDEPAVIRELPPLSAD